MATLPVKTFELQKNIYIFSMFHFHKLCVMMRSKLSHFTSNKAVDDDCHCPEIGHFKKYQNTLRFPSRILHEHHS